MHPYSLQMVLLHHILIFSFTLINAYYVWPGLLGTFWSTKIVPIDQPTAFFNLSTILLCLSCIDPMFLVHEFRVWASVPGCCLQMGHSVSWTALPDL